MSFPRYPEYKDSGVEWLGEVPAHWRVEPLKRVAEVFPSNVDKKSAENEVAVRLCNYTDVYYNDVISSDMEFMTATATVDQVEKFTLRAGDTVITKDSETADDIAISAYVPFDLPGVVCGYHLSVIRPTGDVSGAFIKRVFDSSFIRSSVAVRANGLTRVGLGQYALDNLRVPLPSFAEQRAITECIDRETLKIDALVAEQQRLIELLKEKRQAAITLAITKGLDANAPTKPSGIEGLGDIPANWEMRRVRTVSSFTTSGPRGWSERLGDQGALFIQSGDIDDALGLRYEHAKRVLVTEDAESARTRLYDGDVVVCITGANTGKVGVCIGLAEPAFVNQHLCLIRPVRGCVAQFLGEVLRSEIGQRHFAMRQYGLKQGLSLEDVCDAVVPLPPIDEQIEICAHLSKIAHVSEQLSNEAFYAIDILLERRAALISAAVTGQIDVRVLAAAAEAP